MRNRPSLTIALAVLLVGWPAGAAEDDSPTWTNKAEISFVATDGNAESSSLGFGASFLREWRSQSWKIALAGLRAESTTIERSAIRGIGGVQIVEDEDTELTAENYQLKTRYDHDFDGDWFWHVGAGWEKDEFAGIARRLQAVSGVGHEFWDRDEGPDAGHFKADVGVTWTTEELAAGGDESFAGLRLSTDWEQQVTESTELTHSLEVNQNLDDTDDLRATTELAAHVAINHRLALKTALHVRYDAEPALEEIEITNSPGDTVLVPLEETDFKLTLSLVVKF